MKSETELDGALRRNCREPDDRMLSEEEIDASWSLCANEPSAHYWFARRIEALVRERIAEKFDAEARKQHATAWANAFDKAARLVRGEK